LSPAPSPFPRASRRPTLAAGALALTLTACTLGPDYTPPAANAPGGWTEAASAKSADPQPLVFGPKAKKQLERWWTGFGDPVLDRLVEQAIAGNYDIKVATQRVIEAKADRAIAASSFYPTLSASSQLARYQISGNDKGSIPYTTYSSVGTGFDVSWEPDIFGKIQRQVEAADATLGAQIENRRAVLVSLLGELGTDYMALRSAQERIAIAHRGIALDQDALNLSTAKFKAGLGTELDVAQARAQLEQVRATIPPLATQVAQNAHAIAVLLGRDPGALETELSRDAPLPPSPPALPATIPSQVVRDRPDIREAERTLAAANAQIGVAIAQKFPSFTLSPSALWQVGAINNMSTITGLVTELVGSIKQPILDGGTLDAQEVKAKAVREEDLQTYAKTVISAFREVEDSLVTLNNERERHTTLQREVEADRLALQRATELYRSGIGQFLNVIDSERSLNETEDSLAQSNLTLAQQTIAFYKALGGGWQSADPVLSENDDTPKKEADSR
jgi:NodT family efflux transporter outer membrane factor (OMF) lipoprotein